MRGMTDVGTPMESSNSAAADRSVEAARTQRSMILGEAAIKRRKSSADHRLHVERANAHFAPPVTMLAYNRMRVAGKRLAHLKDGAF